MITLFRRFRQKLVDSGSVPRYLLYAVGEIILVVVGILVALQVNTWNEERNAQHAEAQFIESIKSDLKKDNAELRRVVELGNHKIQVFERLHKELPDIYESDKALLDSLMREFFIAFEGFFPLSGTFDAAVSGNEISSYKNEEFKAMVFDLYNASYVRLGKNLDIMIDRWGYFQKSYKYERLKGELGEMDASDLKELLGNLSFVSAMHDFYINRLLDAELKMEAIILYEN